MQVSSKDIQRIISEEIQIFLQENKEEILKRVSEKLKANGAKEVKEIKEGEH